MLCSRDHSCHAPSTAGSEADRCLRRVRLEHVWRQLPSAMHSPPSAMRPSPISTPTSFPRRLGASLRFLGDRNKCPPVRSTSCEVEPGSMPGGITITKPIAINSAPSATMQHVPPSRDASQPCEHLVRSGSTMQRRSRAQADACSTTADRGRSAVVRFGCEVLLLWGRTRRFDGGVAAMS